MTQNKNTFLVIFIVILFVASGAILYKGFFQSPNGGDVSVESTAGKQKEIVNLLPYGTGLNFKSVAERSGTTSTFSYTAVDPNSVGVDVRGLIAAGPSLTTQ